MSRIGRIVVIALAVVGGLYVVLVTWVSVGCTSQQTALVPSPDQQFFASVGVSRCGRNHLSEVLVLVWNRSEPTISESVFMARQRATGDDGPEPNVYVTWTGDGALQVAYPYYLEVTSKTDNARGVAVSFRRTEGP